jgi:hypothetical protein
VLQALVIYIYSLQGRANNHASWVLSGTALRIAHNMGMHQDGELLGLGPFESEMRRRVWWQILQIDTKFATMSVSSCLLSSSWTRNKASVPRLPRPDLRVSLW